MLKGVWAILLLIGSNVFMTLAWYGHLKLKPSDEGKLPALWLVILISWGIALLEYCLQVPANRLGYREYGGPFSLIQLKVIQEVLSLTVFTVLAMWLFKTEQFRWNHLAGFVCLVLAVLFMNLKK